MGRPESSRPAAQVWFTNGLAEQEPAVRAVEHVEEAVAVALHEQLARLAPELLVDEQQRLLRVPVVGVVGGELEVPHELAGLGPEGEDRVGPQVVAGPPVAVHVGAGVARRPVEEVELGIVAAGQPRGPAPAPQHLGVAPGLRPRLARRGNRPHAPRALAGLGVVGVEEASQPGVAGADARDDEVADHERGHHGAVVLAVVVHLGVPHQLAGEPVEGDDVGVVGDAEHEAAAHRDAAVEPDAGVADEAWSAGLRPAPDLAARRGVEGVHLVDGGDVHHPCDHHRRALDHRHVGNREEPLHGQPPDVVPVDLVERGVAVPGVAAVVGRPVDGGLDRRRAEGVALAAQEGDVAPAGPELRVEAALVEDGAVEGAAPGERQRPGPRPRRPRVARGRGRRLGQRLQVRERAGSARRPRSRSPACLATARPR